MRNFTPDTKKTYAHARKKARQIREDILSLRTTRDVQLAEAEQSFKGEYLEECRVDINAKYDRFVRSMTTEYNDLVADIHQAKTDRLNAEIAKAPTQQQLALLQTVQMRSSVSEAELLNLAEQLAGNYQALKTLADIATQKGHPLYLHIDYDTTLERSAEVHDFLQRMGTQLEAERDDLDLDAFEFFGAYADAETATWGRLTENLDELTYSQVPVVLPKPKATRDEERQLDDLFDRYGHAKPDAIKESVEKAAKSPELRSLIKKSKYSKFLADSAKDAVQQQAELEGTGAK